MSNLIDTFIELSSEFKTDQILGGSERKVYLFDEYALLEARAQVYDSHLLQASLNQAHAMGANVMRVLEIKDEYMLQERANGILFSSENINLLPLVLAEAPISHYQKFLEDVQKVTICGFLLDYTKENFLYSRQKGFILIDLYPTCTVGLNLQAAVSNSTIVISSALENMKDTPENHEYKQIAMGKLQHALDEWNDVMCIPENGGKLLNQSEEAIAAIHRAYVASDEEFADALVVPGTHGFLRRKTALKAQKRTATRRTLLNDLDL